MSTATKEHNVMRAYINRVWGDDRLDARCGEPQENKCGEIALTFTGYHRCSISYSSKYWWAHGGCPNMAKKMELSPVVGFEALKEKILATRGRG